MRKAEAQKLQAELKRVREEVAKAVNELDSSRERNEHQGRQIDNLEADLETLHYENGRQRVRIEALEFSLVLAQDYAQPMQRLLFHQEQNAQTATTGSGVLTSYRRRNSA